MFLFNYDFDAVGHALVAGCYNIDSLWHREGFCR